MLDRSKVDARHTTGEEAGGAGMFAFLIGYMIAFLIYIAITLYGINVMRAIVTEKSESRRRADGRRNQAARDDVRQDPRRRRRGPRPDRRSGSCSAKIGSTYKGADSRRCSV